MSQLSGIPHGLSSAALAIACSTAVNCADAGETAPVVDAKIRSFVLIDQLEHTATQGGSGNQNGLRVNSTAWIGGDYDRLWIYTEATKPSGGSPEDVDIQFLYGRLVTPFWDAQAGIRYTKPGPGTAAQIHAVIGVQGLAPYRLGIQAAAFLSERGKLSGRAEVEYELLLTQKWVVQPRFATNVSLQEDAKQSIGRGVNDIELGIRLRYEVKRELAPYLGITWQKRYGLAAQSAQRRSEDASRWSAVAGIRMWF